MGNAGSALPPALLRAYRQTLYRTTGITVRIGRRGEAMDRLLSAHGVRTAAFITAFNPGSRLRPARWNRRMQARLHQALRRRTALPAAGSLRFWSEDHWLVFGDVRPMQILARRFRQTAIVVVARRQPARLVFIPTGAAMPHAPCARRTRPTAVAAAAR
jgi:hypothetical protein